MASVSSVSSSSSIYGNRNVLTGLASGLDTESMIENVISTYKNKIAALNQKRTKTEWKQEGYRSIINKMATFADKYTSYRSSNNLMSSSFFNSAVKTVAKGKYADKVSATGKASSDVRIDRVCQLATAATYKLSGAALDGLSSTFGTNKVTTAASGTLNLGEDMTVSTLSGSMTLAYGGSSDLSYLSIDFDETKTYESAQDLADEINRQLSEQTVNIGSSSYTGDDLLKNVIRAEVGSDGKITFADPKKNNVYVSGATGTVKEKLLGGKEPSSTYEDQVRSLTVNADTLKTESMTTFDYLSSRGGSMSITLDGVTKTVKLPGKSDIKEGITDPAERDKAFMEAFQKNVDAAFGAGKFTVTDKNGDGEGIQFQFEAAKGSTFSVESSKGSTLGFGESGKVTSYINTGKTLGELLGGKSFEEQGFTKAYTEKKDSAGNTIRTEAKDANGKQLYSFVVNGKEVGQFNEDSTLNEVFNAMNSSSDSAVKVGYSKLTNELTFTAKETGAASTIDFGDKGLAYALFGTQEGEESLATMTKGQDAIFEASVNGTSLGTMTRSSNTIDLDGLSVTLKGTFGYQTDDDGNIQYNTSQATDDNGNLLFSINGKQISAKETAGVLEFYDQKTGKTVIGTIENGKLFTEKTDESGITTKFYAKIDGQGRLRFDATEAEAMNITEVINKTGIPDKNAEAVTFETTSDSDKIVDAVKAMIDDYNAMVTEIKNAYSTLPVQRNNKQYYEPLTDEDKEDMSESAIQAWEEKAKTGILFGDSTLSNLYRSLTSAVSMNGEYGATLRSAGITVSYSNGLSTLEFNESEFRAALDSDPDKVRDAFTASTESGAKSNGLMQSLKQPLDAYGKTSGGKGILVEYAGSPLAPSTMYTNSIQKELNRIDEQIEKWQDKMSDQVDYYTSQFSRLEQLVQQMNSQSSYFSQLMMGG